MRVSTGALDPTADRKRLVLDAHLALAAHAAIGSTIDVGRPA